MDQIKKFAVVDFFKEELVDFVPVNWINGNFCAWPTQHGRGMTAAQLKLKDNFDSKPDEDWLWHPVKILKLCESVLQARELTKRKELNPYSSLDTSEPSTPARKAKRRRTAAQLAPAKRRINVAEKLKRKNGQDLTSSSDELLSDNEAGNLNEPTNKLQFVLPHTDSDNFLVGNNAENGASVDSQQYVLVDCQDQNQGLSSQFQGPLPAQESTYFDQVFSAISVIELQLNAIVSTQNNILTKILSVEEDVKVILAGTRENVVNLKSLIPSHPVTSSLQLGELEAWLADADNNSVLIRYLSCVGEGSVQQIVYAILIRLFANEFAHGVNFTGKNGKECLSNYPKLLQVVKDATTNSKIIDGVKVTEKGIEASIKEWFRTAKGRKSKIDPR